MRVVVDAMGGDRSPAATVEGAVAAARDFGLGILLVGDRTRIEPELGKHKTDGLSIEVTHAGEEVAMDEAPTAALRKSDSSLASALVAHRDGDAQAMVYAGNTGAGMVLAAHILGRIVGVERPAIAVRVPSRNGSTILVDAGANVDARATHLVQFAVMGDAYARVVAHKAAPRVGLLSNGTEPGKGNAAVRESAPILDQLPFNFVGQVEGRELLSGDVDVVVCDGFVGNLVLKSLEGFGSLIGARLKEMLGAGLLRRLAGLILRKHLQALARDLDPNETGGALLLGLNGTVVKAHGSSDGRAIRNAISLAAELARARVSDEVGRNIAACLEVVAREAGVPPEEVEKPGRARRLWTAIRTRLRRAPNLGEEQGEVPQLAGPSEEDTTVSPDETRSGPGESPPEAEDKEKS